MLNLKQLIKHMFLKSYDFQMYHLIINLIMILLFVNVRAGLLNSSQVNIKFEKKYVLFNDI